MEEVQRSGSRVIYLAPLYEYYTCLFFCEREEETLEYDPLRNLALAEEFGRIAAFASDPDQIDIQLLGENRAMLRISQDYLKYAAENGYGSFVDLGWMKKCLHSGRSGAESPGQRLSQRLYPVSRGLRLQPV